MKSERAKEYINCIVPNKCNFDYCAEVGRLNGSIYVDVCKAVDLAEQEAEERMRERAMRAYCYAYGCPHPETCLIGPKRCPAAERFIQKLNEE